MIEDTSHRDPALHLFGMIDSARSRRDGGSGYITDMEAAGQRQVVASSLLPKAGPWGELAALGFVRGEDRDELFCEATLPPGWTREGSDHAMHSYVLDPRGIRMVNVFYKAAFYDRRAGMHLLNPGNDAATEVLYGDGPAVLPAKWELFTEDERAAFHAGLTHMGVEIAEYPTIYGKYADRLAEVRALVEAATS